MKIAIHINILLIVGMLISGSGLTREFPKILQIEGDTLSDWKTDTHIHEVAIRYLLFLMEANDGIRDDHYFIRIKSRDGTVDPQPELYERLSDINLKFYPGSEYKKRKIELENGGILYVPGPSLNLYLNVVAVDNVRVEVMAYSEFGTDIVLHWQDGVWVIEETDYMILR